MQKKTYVQPELRKHGSVGQLTLQKMNTGADATMNMMEQGS